MRLALQDQAVGQGPQAVGGQGRAGGGDIDDQFGGPGSRGPLGRAAGVHDAVVGDAVAREEGPGQHSVLGRHPQAPAGPRQVGHGHLVDVGHGLHIDPALWRGHHEVGAAEAERTEQQHPLVDLTTPLAQQVLANHAQVQVPRVQPRGDVG